jgi:branched-chain amino acid transport system substrate-binding protein
MTPSLRIVTLAAALALGAGAAAQAQQPIKIGMIYSYKGVYATLSESADKGAMLAVDEFGGKVAGRAIEIVRADDEDSNPTIGVQKAEKLAKSDHVQVIAGVISSGVALAMREFAHRNKIPFVVSYGAADQIMNEKCSPYMARTLYAASAFSRSIGNYAATKNKTAATLGPDYAAGHQFIAGFKQGFEEKGGKVVHQEWTAFRKTKDWGPAFAKIKEAGPQVIYSFYGGSEAIQAVKTHANFGLAKSIPLYGDMWLYDSALWDAMGDAVVGGVYGTTWIPALDSAANKKFVAAYQKKFGTTPDVNSVLGYTNIKATLLAAQQLNGDVSDGAKFVKALAGLEFDGPSGKVKFNPKNNDAVLDRVYMVRIEKGPDGKLRQALVDSTQGAPSPSDKCSLGS